MTRLVVATDYGGPEVLAVQSLKLPLLELRQVLIDVKAAAANPIDYKRYSGAFGRDPDALPMPIGMEVAGVISEVDAGVSGFTGRLHVGDAVIASGVRGGYADRVLVNAADVGHKPATMSFEQASGLLLAGGTAWHLLTATGVTDSDTVLVHGAAGGVGLMVVQLAVARGAKVIATASPARHEQLRRYGAQPVEYGPGLADRVRAEGSVDVALDLVGTDEALDTSVELVADRSRIATIAGFARAAELGIAALTSDGDGAAIRAAARPKLVEMAAAGELKVFVDKKFPLEKAADAHRYLQQGHAHGKVVLVP
ncbi:MAG TPA: NADP-dependent oxidoreductase [Mycobacterium sp.]|nr:NADP-dependent oxidoreductase [Mycobacterium sp.]